MQVCSAILQFRLFIRTLFTFFVTCFDYRERVSWFTQREKKEAVKSDTQFQAKDYALNWNSSTNSGAIYKDEVFESIPFTSQRSVKVDDVIDPPDEKSFMENDHTTGVDVVSDTPRMASPRTPRFNRTPSYSPTNPVNHLLFDSDFESGNLSKASRVYGRNKLMESVNCVCASNVPYITVEERNCTPNAVDQEYDLQLSCDLHTTGNIQWYYFSASTPPTIKEDFPLFAGLNKATNGSSATSSPRPPLHENVITPPSMGFHPASITPVVYPLTVRFNIVNMMKSDALYNYGMKPAVYSERENVSTCGHGTSSTIGWKHAGDFVCYFKNSKSYMKKRKDKVSRSKYYTLSFTYTFEGPDTVYFAHCFPYTYTMLETFLNTLETDRRIASFLRRKLLCYTLANNRCDLLTITSPSTNHSDMMRRPVIVVSARVHPGETNSSYMMEGFLSFITSEESLAQQLRDNFVFKVVPMLNPDGVIHGNYRCSLAGVDLNRKYNNPDQLLHPTIFSMKSLLKNCQKDRGVLLYLDLHGHSQNKNTFLYGCDPLQSNIRSVAEGVNRLTKDELTNYCIFPRIFPKVLVAASNAYAADKVDADVATRNGMKSKGSLKFSSNQGKLRQNSAGQFSFRDCSLKVQRSKAGTGRVVSWSDVGINAAYTIEISFCGSGNNAERKLIKSYALQRLKGLNNESEENVPVNEKLRAILKTYQTEKHYSQECLRDLGKQICLAMSTYGNLGVSAKRGADKYRQRQPDEGVDDDVSVENDSRNNYDDEEDDTLLDLPQLYEVDTEEELHQPFLQPSIISEKLLAFVVSEDLITFLNYTAKDREDKNVRLETEIALRKSVRVMGVVEKAPQSSSSEVSDSIIGSVHDPCTKDSKKVSKMSTKGSKKRRSKKEDEAATYNFSLAYETEDGEEDISPDENEDVGSDSDPSGDEATPLALSQSKVFMKLTSLSKNALITKRKNGKNLKKRRPKQKKREKSSVKSDDQPTSSDKPTKGRSSPAPHRVAIAESALLLNPNSTAYNQTISTSARRSTIRIKRMAVDPSGKRVVQSYHSFQELQCTEEVSKSLRVTSLTTQAGHLSKSTSLDQISSSQMLPTPQPTHPAVRVAKPRNILSSDPCTSEYSRDTKIGGDAAYHRTTSVIEAVRNYKAAVKSPPLSPPRDRNSGEGDVGVGIACKPTTKDRIVYSQLPVATSPSLSSPVITSPSPNKTPVFPRPTSSSPPQTHALMSSSSKKLLLRSSELETLQRLANMDIGKESGC